MTDFYITVAPDRDSIKQVYGPFGSYDEAFAAGEPFAREGLIVESHRADLVCDFCSEPEVKWSYPAKDIASEELHWGSRGDWAACEICHALIEKGERDKLAERSMQNFIRFNPEFASEPAEIRKEVADGIRMLHDIFFLARTGEAEKETHTN